MGFLSRLSTTVGSGRLRAAWGGADDDRWFVPSAWIGAMSAAGLPVTPELAMTLAAVYCAVTTIADDIGTLPCQFFKYRDDGGKDRIRGTQPGIGGLVYMLRWQPNSWQTATEFWKMLLGHYLLRNIAYAQIVYRPNGNGFVDELIPRHPDRVSPQRLASGRIRYQITKPDGTYDYLTQDEMFVLRDLSFDGLKGISRVAYGAQGLGAALAAEKMAATYFKTGVTAAKVLVHKGGELGDDEEKELHTSISRFSSGVQNAGGFLIIEDDIEIKDLGVDPEKMQLLATRQDSVKLVARLFKIPGHKLEAEQQTAVYAAREQANLEYIMGTLRPIVIGIEQSIQRDLILTRDVYFAEFLMDALFRGDMKSRAEYYKTAIRNRWMTSNEVRLKENLNPIEGGDELCPWNTATAALDGEAGGEAAHGPARARLAGTGSTASVRATLLVHDNALRVIRRERAAVEKLAKKYPSDVEAWQKELRAFYDEHRHFVAQTMRLSTETARVVCAQHGSLIEASGIVAMDEAWERTEAEDLAALTLDGSIAA